MMNLYLKWHLQEDHSLTWESGFKFLILMLDLTELICYNIWQKMKTKRKTNMNKIIAVIGILSSLILTGCDPELTYFDEELDSVSLIKFNGNDNIKMIGFNTIETNDIVSVIINFKKQNKWHEYGT